MLYVNTIITDQSLHTNMMQSSPSGMNEFGIFFSFSSFPPLMESNFSYNLFNSFSFPLSSRCAVVSFLNWRILYMILFLSYVSGLFCGGWTFKLVASVKSCSFFSCLAFFSFCSTCDSTWCRYRNYHFYTKIESGCVCLSLVCLEADLARKSV